MAVECIVEYGDILSGTSCKAIETAGGHLNMKMLSYQYSDSYYKLSYQYNGNPHTWEDGLYIEKGPGAWCQVKLLSAIWVSSKFNGSVQERCNSSAYALELHLALTHRDEELYLHYIPLNMDIIWLCFVLFWLLTHILQGCVTGTGPIMCQ